MRDTAFPSFAFVVLFSLAGCGGDDTPPAGDSGSPPADLGASDLGMLIDSGATDDLGTDVDSGATNDAGEPTDSGAELDGGGATMCAPGSAIPDRVSGVCDGRGRAICTMWATTSGGAGAVAQCVPATGVCARADACSSAGCTCGADAECADDQMCVPDSAGGYKCACITP